jgi:hypothetical protein
MILSVKLLLFIIQQVFNKYLPLILQAKLIFYNEGNMTIACGMQIALTKVKSNVSLNRDTAMRVLSLFKRQDGISGSR